MVERFNGRYPFFPDAAPQWRGEQLQGKTILLDGRLARGYGDYLNFIRFASFLQSQGAVTAVRAPRQLERVLENAQGVNFVVPPWGRPAVNFVGDMAAVWLVGQGIDVSSAGPYINALPSDAKPFKKKPGLHVGITWKTADSNLMNPYTCKNISLSQFSSLARIESVWLTSLQTPSAAGELSSVFGEYAPLDAGALFRDFGDTASAIFELDIVVTVDTAVAHVAGALHKPTMLLLPYAAEWRWLLDRSDSPWYPSFHCIRQPAPGDWTSVIKEVSRRLREIASSYQRESRGTIID
jgi:hypothetical protein